MSYPSLASFIDILEAHNELCRIKSFVSPELCITEITDRVSKAGGKALLFENTGTQFPLLINSLGSEKRMCLALGVERLDEISERIMELAGNMMQPRASLMEKLSLLPTLAGVASWRPKKLSGRGKCQEVVIHDPDLSILPVLTCWPHDGGPFITLPVVHTRHPETGQRNVGMYRMQVMGKDITGMHWHLHKNSAAHFREYKRLGMRMPVAVALGGDPAYMYSATAPLPENVDEYLLAGFIRKKSVQLVKCISSDIEVPADADIIIEGYVDPTEDLVLEGPFGDHTGFYSLADYYPKFHVTCITHRKNAVYPTTIVGTPPQEDAWIGKATERIFLSPIRLTMLPEVMDMAMPVEGVFHNIVLVKIHKTFPGQAQKVMNSLWGAGQMMFNKVLVVLDQDVELKDYTSVMKAIAEHADPLSDLVFTKGPVDVLDHSSRKFAVGSKFGIDATRKFTEEKSDKPFLDIDKCIKSLSSLNEVEIDFSYLSAGFRMLLVYVEKDHKGQVREVHSLLEESGAIEAIDYVMYMDSCTKGLPAGDLIWLAANNIDPMRDCYFSGEKGKDTAPLVIDGTMKTRQLDDFDREWPNVIVMSDEVILEIDSRWEEFGLGDFIPSPSLRYRQLVKNIGAVASE